MAIGARIASKTAGIVRNASKAMEGQPGIFHHLAGEHEEVAALMDRLTEGDHSTRAELYPVIHKNLLAHSLAEEETFYPELLRFPRIHDLAGHCLAEHARIQDMLRVLNSSDKDTLNWMEIFEQLKDVVQNHVACEENELFPQAMELLKAREMDDIQHRFRQVERRERARFSR